MIQTFVFFDIETTGLIVNNVMPRIIELSFVAVPRDNIHFGQEEIPRVLQTLTVPVNPNKTISEVIENLTGLKNEFLQNVSLFNEKIFYLINNFLNTLTSPICFVAHNGYRFDYPIFLSELGRLNKDLDQNILCVDTLPLFKNFFQYNSKLVIKDVIKTSNISNSPGCSEDKNSNVSLSEKKTESNPIVDEELNIQVPTKKENNIYETPKNFKLTTIYEHLLNIPPKNAHTAEGDCINMLRCANCLGEYFLKWCDDNAKLLIEQR